MVYSPENLIDSEAIAKWVTPYRRYLIAAMKDLKEAGLLKDFLLDDPGNKPVET